MATGFDPYHRWLSIPPSEQPANHYRLLGVAAYEADVEVIQNAAERQSRHVRSHLRSPLGAYAVNLIREIEVARLCLIDPEAKRAYDAWLEIRPEHEGRAASQPSTSQHVGKPDNIRRKSEFSPLDEIPSSLAIGPSIVTHRYGRKKRKSAPIYFVLMWLVSGAIGLLGGYAVLCLIDPQYDFLHVMFRHDQPDAMSGEHSVVPSVVNETGDKRQPSLSAERANDQKIASSPFNPKNSFEVNPDPMTPRLDELRPDGEARNGLVKKKNENLQGIDNLRPVVLPFDLKKRVIRVVSIPGELHSQNICCNVDGSAELGMSPLVDFPLGGKRDVLFRVGINDVTVGFELSFIRRNKSVVVEIRPKFKLPSGDEEALYKLAGVKKAKILSNQVSAATIAQSSLPGMRTQLSRVTVEYDSVKRVAYTPTTTGQVLTQVAAQRRAAALFDHGAALENQIRDAESMSAKLPRLHGDLAAVQQLGEWGAKIAESATLTVSIQCDGAALVAELK